jgi:2,3-bisphosphoglycerate-independent phosphoglycerate mutase
MNARPRPLVLCILDGWGERQKADDNAIEIARAPNWHGLRARWPHAQLQASEHYVGLPDGQMGNSEVGHTNIGAGRVVLQDLPRIDVAIAEGKLATLPGLCDFIGRLKESRGTAHLMGLMSPGGVHSHQRQIAALARILAEAGVPVAVHAFLDGRDTPPKAAVLYVRQFQEDVAGLRDLRIATLCGRYYAMDRDKRWDRVERAYRAIVAGVGERTDDPLQAVEAAYARAETDEFVTPTAIAGYVGMRDGDGLLIANFRADRIREIATALLDPEFSGFTREKRVAFCAALGLVEYSTELNRFLATLFPPENVNDSFGEERILVPSPKVATYDQQPEMSAPEVTDKVVEAIRSGRFDAIVMNYANADMVGHTGRIDAATKAVETIDFCLGRLSEAVEQAGGTLVITADHGNAEMMRDRETGEPHTAHTLNPVPFVVVNPPAEIGHLENGRLSDIAPTLLDILGLTTPAAMTGHSLISSTAGRHAAN